MKLLVVLAALLLEACAGMGPIHQANLPELMQAGVPKDDGAIEFSAPSEWFPDSQGFVEDRAGGILIKRPEFREGIFALTPIALVFLQWDPALKSYSPVYRVTYPDIQSEKVDAFGRNRRIVIFGKDYRAQSFGIYGASGGMVDQKAVQRAHEIIASRIAPHDKS